MNKLSDLSSASASPSRFSLVLLEPGDIYFEDYLVYYHELRCPFDAVEGGGGDAEGFSSHHQQPIKGNLKICSKSVVFDPISFSYPVVKFSYKSVDRIESFNEDENNGTSGVNDNDDDDDDLYTIKTSSQKKKDNNKRHKCFAINCRQTINCKVSIF